MCLLQIASTLLCLRVTPWILEHVLPDVLLILVRKGPPCLQIVTETLRLLIVNLDTIARQGTGLQASCMLLLVQVLVLCATPTKAEQPASLKQLVPKTMTLLASGPHAAAFRAALPMLSAKTRNTLQVGRSNLSLIYPGDCKAILSAN